MQRARARVHIIFLCKHARGARHQILMKLFVRVYVCRVCMLCMFLFCFMLQRTQVAYESRRASRWPCEASTYNTLRRDAAVGSANPRIVIVQSRHTHQRRRQRPQRREPICAGVRVCCDRKRCAHTIRSDRDVDLCRFLCVCATFVRPSSARSARSPPDRPECTRATCARDGGRTARRTEHCRCNPSLMDSGFRLLNGRYL